MTNEEYNKLSRDLEKAIKAEAKAKEKLARLQMDLTAEMWHRTEEAKATPAEIMKAKDTARKAFFDWCRAKDELDVLTRRR